LSAESQVHEEVCYGRKRVVFDTVSFAQYGRMTSRIPSAD
jgi:hypothetical protein